MPSQIIDYGVDTVWKNSNKGVSLQEGRQHERSAKPWACACACVCACACACADTVPHLVATRDGSMRGRMETGCVSCHAAHSWPLLPVACRNPLRRWWLLAPEWAAQPGGRRSFARAGTACVEAEGAARKWARRFSAWRLEHALIDSLSCSSLSISSARDGRLGHAPGDTWAGARSVLQLFLASLFGRVPWSGPL